MNMNEAVAEIEWLRKRTVELEQRCVTMVRMLESLQRSNENLWRIAQEQRAAAEAAEARLATVVPEDITTQSLRLMGHA